jgi:hypothetical protein
MRDWAQVAREELARRGLDCGDDVAAELGAFLDDAYRECVASGADPGRAVELTSSQAGDWAQLARRLKRLEEVPMERAKRLWIPGLVNAALAFGLLRAATAAGLEPFVRLRGYSEFVVYWQWLPVVALLAGITAWSSARAGGCVREQLIAGLSPSLAMLTLLLFLVVVGTVAEVAIRMAFPESARDLAPMSVRLEGLAGMLATWVLVPGIVSLLGALPFIRRGPFGHRPPTLSLPT